MRIAIPRHPVLGLSMVAIIACSGKIKPGVVPTGMEDVELLMDGRAIDCSNHSCGGNSAYLFGSVVHTLNVDGASPWGGVTLIQGTLRGGGCGDDPVDLVVKNGQIVGKAKDGRVACEKLEVKGATFDVEFYKIAGTIEIADVGTVTTLAKVEDDAETLYTYQFKNRGRNVCQRHEAWVEEWQTPKVKDEVWTTWVDKKSRHALLVSGETYDETKIAIAQRGAGWFNIACAGSAVAKMRLYGLDPAAAGADAQEQKDKRQAMLKMLTASYCGVRITNQGIPIAWRAGAHTDALDARVEVRSAFHGDTPPEYSAGPVEAQWGPEGAVCLQHLRISRKGLPFSDPLWEAADRVLLHKSCRIERCSDNHDTGSVHWTSWTADHVDED